MDTDHRLEFGQAWEYAPAPESTPVPLRDRYEPFINGEFVEGRGGEIPSIQPSTAQTLTKITPVNEAQLDEAVQAASRAFEGEWGKTTPRDRGKYLFRIARLIQERSRELAILETMDNGKPIKESRDFDLPQVAAHFFYYAGWADKLAYAKPGTSPDPVGVVGQVIPWNFPLMMMAWKIAPALACGNTVVIKPAETTSVTALHLAELFQIAGLPPGVVNVVTGEGNIGQALVRHSGIDKIAFTGSTEVGKEIAASVAGTEKRLTLELGGKAAHLIFEDAPLDQAVEGIVQGIFFNQGQVCCAGSRLLVQESVEDEVLERLARRIQTLRVGDPLDKNSDVGAIHSEAQLTRIQELVQSGIEDGATLTECQTDVPKEGYWFRPTILTGVSGSQRVVQEEIFGPVLSVMTFRTPDEAVQRANHTPYGLSAGLW
ncbi:MAG: aldehyde dehydrogenase family protein, partial [Verrucomicrobiota bacterium]